MEAVRAWFDKQEQAGRKPCSNLHVHPRGTFLCEPFRPIVDGTEPPTHHPESFDAALRLIRQRGANGGTECENRFAASRCVPFRPAESLRPETTVPDARKSVHASCPAESLCVPVNRHDASFSGQPVEPRYLTYAQAADWLGVKPKTIRNWVCSGKLVPVRVFGLPRFTPEYLDRIVEARRGCVAPQEEAANATQNAEPGNTADRG
jgi:hypothetical protein